MADNHSKEIRSYNMSKIKSDSTKPEEIVRKYLFSRGFRYRKNDKRVVGKPDVVLPKYKTIVFVHGCFWHMHENCPDFVLPKTNTEYWESKLFGNKARDERITSKLLENGWKVIVVWECELKTAIKDERLSNLCEEIT